jgi:hypothetical protein
VYSLLFQSSRWFPVGVQTNAAYQLLAQACLGKDSEI